MRKFFIMLLLIVFISQFMSYADQNTISENNQTQTKPDSKSDPIKGINYISEDKLESGTRLRAMLDNGLEVMIQELNSSQVVKIQASVKAALLYEGKFLGTGISHFCEHLVSRGSTNKRTEEESAEILRSIGDKCNAFTGGDITGYHITTIGEYAETAIDLIGDWVSGCIFDEDEFKREKGVVAEEIKDHHKYSNNNIEQSTFYKDTPFSEPILGHASLLEKLTREQVIEYFNERYCPNNTVLSIVGGIDAQETLRQVVKHFGKWQRKPLKVTTIPGYKGQLSEKQYCYTSEAITGDTAQLHISYHTFSKLNKDQYALKVLEKVMSSETHSSLVKRLWKDEQLVSNLIFDSDAPYFGFGGFYFNAMTTYDKLSEVKSRIFNELESLQTMDVRDIEIQNAKKEVENWFTERYQGINGLNTLNTMCLLGNLSSNYAEKYIEEINKVTAEQIKEVVNKYLTQNKSLVYAVYSKKAEQKDKDHNPFTNIEETKSSELGKSKNAEIITLENGMRIILKKTPGTKNVAIQAVTPGGKLYENPENRGIFTLMTRLMSEGSEKYSYKKISEIETELGGRISFKDSYDLITTSMDFISCSGRMEQALSMLNDVLRNPKFDKDEYDKLITLFKRPDNGNKYAYSGYYRLLEKFFAPHPYSYQKSIVPDKVEKLTLDMVKEYHAKFIVPNNFVMAIVGDFDMDTTIRIARGLFSDWEKSSEMIKKPTDFKMRTTKNEIREQYSGSRVLIGFGYNAPKRANQEEVTKLHILNAVVAGLSLPSGWMAESLRGGDNNYVYNLFGGSIVANAGGIFYFFTQCSPEDKDKVIEIIRNQIKRTWTENISDKELDEAKRMYKIERAFILESNKAKATNLAYYEYLGLDWKSDQTVMDIVDKITVDDLKALAEKYFKNNELLMIIEPKIANK